jgi:hypothetical protein
VIHATARFDAVDQEQQHVMVGRYLIHGFREYPGDAPGHGRHVGAAPCGSAADRRRPCPLPTRLTAEAKRILMGAAITLALLVAAAIALLAVLIVAVS